MARQGPSREMVVRCSTLVMRGAGGWAIQTWAAAIVKKNVSLVTLRAVIVICAPGAPFSIHETDDYGRSAGVSGAAENACFRVATNHIWTAMPATPTTTPIHMPMCMISGG